MPEELDVNRLVGYLRKTGWKHAHCPNHRLLVFTGFKDDDGRTIELVLPSRSDFLDSRRRIDEAIYLLAAVEASSVHEVLQRIRSTTEEPSLPQRDWSPAGEGAKVEQLHRTGWNDFPGDLRDILVDLYPTVALSVQVAKRAQVPIGRIALGTSAQTSWFNILTQALRLKKVDNIVTVAREDHPQEAALSRYLENVGLLSIHDVDIETAMNWESPTDSKALEALIGSESWSLPVSFLEQGLQKARSVARIVRRDGFQGTGFLTDGNLLITTNHVLDTVASAQSAIAQFGPEETASSLSRPVQNFELDVRAGFFTWEELNWTAVRVKGNPGEVFGQLTLEHTAAQPGDRVSIIEYPVGASRQIASFDNIVVSTSDSSIEYLSATTIGSAGSPVFDGGWRVLALHLGGGHLREPTSKGVYYRNEGIHVNAIIDGIAWAGM